VNAELASVWYKPAKDPDDVQEEQERAASLIDSVARLENLQREVHEQNLWNAQLYSNRELAHFDWGHGTYYRASLAPISTLGENIVLEVVDTMVTQVGKNRPKVKPVTHGASFKLRKQAVRLDRWLYGEFIRNKVYAKSKKVFRDCTIFGFGAFLIHFDKKLDVERVFPDEVVVDQQEVAALGKPRHIYRRRALPASMVADMFGIDVADLMAHRVTDYTDYRFLGPDYVVVAEAWRAATADEPGRYMAACHGHVLKEQVWKAEWLPWVFMHYQDPPSGFYCPSAVELALFDQIRLNEINEVIRDAQDLMARPRVFVAEGSRVSAQEIDNLVARVIRYTGTMPTAAVWPAISAELYQERDRIRQTCLGKFGLNTLMSQGQLPAQARLDSSAALREATDISGDRLSDLSQRFEEMFLELGETMVRVMGEMPGYKTVWLSGGKKARRETIDWDEIDIDENSYTLTLEASSVFSMTPSARRDDLETQLARGEITPERYRQMLANPDTEGETDILAAAADDIDRVIELLEDGKYEDPAEEQDLIQGVQRITLAMLNLRKYEEYEKGDADMLSVEINMLQWLSVARSILEKGTETPPQAPPTLSDVGAAPGMVAPPSGLAPGPAMGFGPAPTV